VTCHDGFTLNDLVSHNQKHNEANGENNHDGCDANLSWNCGAEGPTDDPTVEALRNRQINNFFVLELLSAGTPMLLMGDEVRRTQRGNNNAYCQDSDISWFDWSLLERHADIHGFVKMLGGFRQRRGVRYALTPFESKIIWSKPTRYLPVRFPGTKFLAVGLNPLHLMRIRQDSQPGAAGFEPAHQNQSR
jgi:pullulanase/glycogen debranching enzyme